jgi:hypothetical protein
VKTLSKRKHSNDIVSKVWRVPRRPKNGKWKPVVRIGRHVPWGYDQDPDNQDILIPNVPQLELLEEGRIFMRRGYSLRQVAEWLSEETGRYISHVGLRKRIDTEERRRRALRNLRVYKKRLEQVLAAIDKLENDRIGTNTIDDVEELLDGEFAQGPTKRSEAQEAEDSTEDTDTSSEG